MFTQFFWIRWVVKFKSQTNYNLERKGCQINSFIMFKSTKSNMYLLTAEGKGGQREHRSTVTVFYQMIACHVPGTVCFAASQNFRAREWRRCPMKKLNTSSTATHCGRICLKRLCFLDAWPRPSLLSKQFSPINIVLNDSAQRLVTLYLAFTWFERYLNETKQAE